MQEVQHRIYAEQNETTTNIMIQVEGDKPICLISYARALVSAAKSVTGVII